MADSSFGLRVGLEGEREFKRAITDINRKMRVLGPTRSWSMVPFGTKHCHPGQILGRQDLPGPSINQRGMPQRLLREFLPHGHACSTTCSLTAR